MRQTIALWTLVLCTFGFGGSDAQSARVSWRCEFVPSFKEPFTFIYESGTAKGVIVGNIGTAEVWVHEGLEAVSFLEPIATGAVQSTTIIVATGEAVHSRNTIELSDKATFFPSQVLGNCKIWN